VKRAKASRVVKAGRVILLAKELSQQAGELARSRQTLETQTRMLQSVLDSMQEGLVRRRRAGSSHHLESGRGEDSWHGRNQPALPGMDHALWPLPGRYGDTLPHRPVALDTRHPGRGMHCEMFVRNPEFDEGVWIEVSASPLKDRDGAVNGGVAAFRDVTQRRVDEREIRKLNEELESA